MLLSEINPFIRFSGEVVLTKNTDFVSTVDHRLLFVTDGEGTAIIDGAEKSITVGTVMLWKSNTKYKFAAKNFIKLIAFNFDYTWKNQDKKFPFSPVKYEFFSHDSILEKITFSDTDVLNAPIVLDNMQELYKPFAKIFTECRKKLAFSSEYCSALLKEIIIYIVRAALISTPAAFNKLDKIIKFVETNYASDISNEELAAAAGYHPYHVNRLMKEYTGLTLHKYIVEYRLKKSCELLANTSFCINEISEMCGFKSAYYFAHGFKKKFGSTPTEYRKNAKNSV